MIHTVWPIDGQPVGCWFDDPWLSTIQTIKKGITENWKFQCNTSMEWDTREASILKICLKRILYSKTFLAMKNKWWLPKLTVLEKLTFQCNNFWYVKNKLSLAISYCSVRTKILIWIMSNNVRTNSFLVDLQNGAEVKQRIQSDKVKTCLSNIFSKFKKWCQKMVIPRSMNSEKVGGWHRWRGWLGKRTNCIFDRSIQEYYF